LDADWKSCPYCGKAIIESSQPSVSIKDSVVKELHQTQETSVHEASGANVGGSIYIKVTRDVNESRPLTSTEKQYEQFVIMLLQSGENLEYARVELGQLREQLGLSLKRTAAIEMYCLTEVNRATSEEVDKNGLNKGDITMKACTKCGKLVSDQAKFCDNCGASLPSNVESITTRPQATQTPSSNVKRKIKQLCPFCQGTGLQPGATFTNQKCPTCKGYRYNLIEEGSPQCAICHGSGRVKAQGMVLMGPNFVRCPACGGTGADQDF